MKIDPAQLDQILANLAVNARDAIGGVGNLTIETQKAAFDQAYCATHPGFQPGDFELLAVSDGGFINVYSEPGHGSTFKVYLPRAEGTAAQMAEAEEALRMSEEREGLKCLYMSGYTSDAIAHRGILEEGVSFIPKPFPLATLAGKVREVLDG